MASTSFALSPNRSLTTESGALFATRCLLVRSARDDSRGLLGSRLLAKFRTTSKRDIGTEGDARIFPRVGGGPRCLSRRRRRVRGPARAGKPGGGRACNHNGFDPV